MKLSIIIPVYNTEKYLKRCLNSVIKAKIEKTEIIIINDGSKDNSLKIIKEYANKYEFIRYISKKNEGLAATKNLGIKEAKGKYISFVDSDDTINEDFYKEALEFINREYDIIIYDFNNITDKNTFVTEAKSSLYNDYEEKEALLYTSIMPSSCNKIVKTGLYRKIKLFPKGILYEDLATTPQLFLLAQKIKYINKPYYNYYLNNSSIMRNNENKKHMLNMIKSLTYLYKRTKGKFKTNDFYIFTCLWRIEDYVYFHIYENSSKRILLELLHINKLLKIIYSDKRVIKCFENIEDEYTRNFYKLRNKYVCSNNYLKLIIFMKKNNLDNNKKIDFCYKFNDEIIKISNFKK